MGNEAQTYQQVALEKIAELAMGMALMQGTILQFQHNQLMLHTLE